MNSDDFVPFDSSKNLLDGGNKDGVPSSSSFALPALITDVRAPWMQYCQSDTEGDSSSTSLVRLHNEILTFCEYIAPTKAELAAREQVVNEIIQITKEIWPQAEIKIFGSQMTKILTPSSDLDVAIINVPEGDGGLIERLYDLEKIIREKDLVTYIEVLSNAKVPIVKLDHRRTGISIDICLNNTSGLSTGKLIKGFVRTYPPLRPLTMVLKMFLSQRRLNETYGGGMGSFVLCTVIISFLQMREKNDAYRGIQQSWNLGALLLDFFALYGNSFNFVHTGISISNGGSYFLKLDRMGWFNSLRPMSLALENPEDITVDIGKNSFQLPKIRRAFEHAQQVLTCALMDNRVESFLSFLIRPDDPVLTGRPGPGLISLGISSISDSEDDSDGDVSTHADRGAKGKQQASQKKSRAALLLEQRQHKETNTLEKYGLQQQEKKRKSINQENDVEVHNLLHEKKEERWEEVEVIVIDSDNEEEDGIKVSI